MRLVLVLLAFNFIIIIHELGHFIVAKLSRIKVEEFSLFIGPKIFSFKRGETTYSLRTFPLLAYVKMEGEEEESDSERAFHRKPVWVRALVIAAGPLANLLAAFVIISIVYSVVGYGTTTIREVSEDSPAYTVGMRKGDTIVGYDNKRIYQPMEVMQFLYVSKGKPTEIEFLSNGQEIEKKIEPVIERTYMLGFYPEEKEGVNTNVVGELIKGGPADKAGMKTGDRIIALNDTKVSDFEEIKSFLKENKEAPVNVTVQRGETQELISVVPKYNERYIIGIAFSYEKGDNFIEVMKNGALFTYSNVRMVPITLSWLITGKVSFTQMVGPVGIVTTMNEAAQESDTFRDALLSILLWTALISAAIGATNLIPFPALDGSKLLLLAIEAVSRKKIPMEKEAIIMTIGFFILIGLSIFVLSNDIMNFIIK